MSNDAAKIPYRIFTERGRWRDWLEQHHASATDIWLGFYKRGSDKTSISNSAAVEEALCFGWINGKLRRLDDELYIQRFSPRHAHSVWAPSNRARVARLIQSGQMTEAGLKLVQEAKRNGSWEEVEEAQESPPLPVELQRRLQQQPAAREFFRRLSPSQQRDYLWWIKSAKRAETRQRRIEAVVERCGQGLKPGQA